MNILARGGDRPWIRGQHWDVDEQTGSMTILDFPEGIELVWSATRGAMVPKHPPVFEVQVPELKRDRGKSGPKPNLELIAEIRRCVGDGLSLQATARELRVAYSYVYRLAERSQMVEPRKPRTWTPIDPERLRELAAKGLTQGQIATALGKDRSAIHKALKRYGIAVAGGKPGRKRTGWRMGEAA